MRVCSAAVSGGRAGVPSPADAYQQGTADRAAAAVPEVSRTQPKTRAGLYFPIAKERRSRSPARRRERHEKIMARRRIRTAEPVVQTGAHDIGAEAGGMRERLVRVVQQEVVSRD